MQMQAAGHSRRRARPASLNREWEKMVQGAFEVGSQPEGGAACTANRRRHIMHGGALHSWRRSICSLSRPIFSRQAPAKTRNVFCSSYSPTVQDWAERHL